MPCSRSARRPSVTNERSTSPRPRRSLAVSIAVSWSSKSWRVSKRSRPMSVLLPSSTDPMVAKRRRSMVSAPSSAPAGGAPGRVVMGLEISFALAVLHCRLREAVVGPGGAAFGDSGTGDLADDLLDRVGTRAHRPGAGGVTHRAEAHGLLADLFGSLRAHPLAEGEQHAVAFDDLALVRVVDRRQLDPLPPDVLPDVELGPVGEGEGRQVFAGPHGALVELPEFGSLALRVPLTEGVAKREHPLLGPGLVLVSPGPAKGGVEAVGVDGVEQGGRLEAVAHTAGTRVRHATLIDRLLDAGHEEPGSDRLHLR